MAKVIIDEREMERLKPLLTELAHDERMVHEAVAEVTKWAAEEVRLKTRVEKLRKCLDILGPHF